MSPMLKLNSSPGLTVNQHRRDDDALDDDVDARVVLEREARQGVERPRDVVEGSGRAAPTSRTRCSSTSRASSSDAREEVAATSTSSRPPQACVTAVRARRRGALEAARAARSHRATSATSRRRRGALLVVAVAAASTSSKKPKIAAPPGAGPRRPRSRRSRPRARRAESARRRGGRGAEAAAPPPRPLRRSGRRPSVSSPTTASACSEPRALQAAEDVDGRRRRQRSTARAVGLARPLRRRDGADRRRKGRDVGPWKDLSTERDATSGRTASTATSRRGRCSSGTAPSSDRPVPSRGRRPRRRATAVPRARGPRRRPRRRRGRSKGRRDVKGDVERARQSRPRDSGPGQ